MKQFWWYLLLFVCFSCTVLLIAFWRTLTPAPVETSDSGIPASSQTVTAPGSPSVVTTPIRLLFVGDMMFDRDIRLRMQQHGPEYILQELVPFLATFDIVTGNLEGPITDKTSRSVRSPIGSSSNFIFTFDPNIAPTIKQQGINVVNLGNNHILNFGQTGVASTKDYLNQAQVSYFGDTSTEHGPMERTLLLEKQRTKIGFANYNQFVPEGYEHALTDIEYLRPKVDVLVVFTHWGNEYVPTANNVIAEQAHAFIDLGADLVVGTHPHVIQNSEQYRGKYIFYSLGNAVFDQYFSTETQKGLLVEMEVDPASKALQFREHFVQLSPSGQTKLLL